MKKLKIFALCLCLFALTSCSPITRASGEIVDANGAALAAARVKITGKSLAPNAKLEFVTGADGKYNFGEFYVSAQLPIEVKLTVEKEGFKTFEKDLKFNEDNVDKIILDKAGN